MSVPVSDIAERYLWIQPGFVTECVEDADLAVVDDLLKLPAWTRQAAAPVRNWGDGRAGEARR